MRGAPTLLLLACGCTSGSETDPAAEPPACPHIEPSAARPVRIKSLYDHTCALLEDGTARCWGSWNLAGELGDGTRYLRKKPVTVQCIDHALAILPALEFTCALMADRTVRCWGDNLYGTVGIGAGVSVPLPTTVPGVDHVVSLATGGLCALALRSDGTALHWGCGLGLDDQGRYPVPAPYGVPDGAVAVAHDCFTVCAILADGLLSCWGYNKVGELGDGTTVARDTPDGVPGLTDVLEVTQGAGFVCARQSNGEVYCWGWNQEGELGDGTMMPRHSVPQTPVLANAVRVAAAEDHACVATIAGRVLCWGANDFGQLGNGTFEQALVPTEVPGIEGAIDVATGTAHTCALLGDGRIFCWGDNISVQLGTGNEVSSPVPVEVLW